jgi:hypothetical protein
MNQTRELMRFIGRAVQACKALGPLVIHKRYALRRNHFKWFLGWIFDGPYFTKEQ